MAIWTPSIPHPSPKTGRPPSANPRPFAPKCRGGVHNNSAAHNEHGGERGRHHHSRSGGLFFFFRVGIRSVTFPWISWQWSRASSVAISESNVCMCICVSSGHSCEISAQMCFCPEVADKAATSCLASYTKDRTFFRELLQELRRYQKKRSCQLRNGSVQTDAFGDRQ